MKNLDLWDLSRKHLNSLSSDDFKVCRGREEDNREKSAIYVCSSNLLVTYYDENGKVQWEKDLTCIASPSNSPVNITYLTLQHILVVGLRNGELFSISSAGRTCKQTGHIIAGLLAMEWSPEQELLILVTKKMTMMIVSCAFDHVKETKLLDKEFGEKEFVNVGWGKTETQFQGRSGKQKASLNEVSADLGSPIDNTVKISWRGDGRLFAIGYSEDGIRRFKVFNRLGNLQYTSEKQPGLEANLAWRPSGNVIATTQALTDKYVVSFFEKNGLKHGEFQINVSPSMMVEDIAWSNDSEILTLQCKDVESNSQQLLLYTTGNYHWYLKQTLRFSSKHKISKIMWDCAFDVIHNKRLYVFLQNGELYTYDWVWVTNHSKGKTEGDDAVVAVIDDKKLLITAFRHAVVPPPMASLEIALDDYVDSIHFAPEHAISINPNSFFVITANQQIIFFEQTQKNPLQYRKVKAIQLDNYEFPFQSYNWYWVNADIVICILLDTEYSYDLMEFSIKGSDMRLLNACQMPSSITRIQPHPFKSSDTIFIQLNSGELISYTLGGDIDPQDVFFQKACPQFGVIGIENNLHFFGLTHKGQLQIDNMQQETTVVSSIFVHTHFLLMTTLDHELVCTELTELGMNAIKGLLSPSDLLYKRKIERSSKLVIVVPCDNRTVLQMQRGNLEAIQPRPLSLKIIGEYLDNSKYFEAFNLMRKQRINLNLIYDHNPEVFTENVDIFLESIKNNSWLNLFLADLENADVTKSMYNNSYVGKPEKLKQDIDTKIVNICDLVRDKLNLRKDKDAKVLPIITTYVKKNTVEELEKALLIIKELKSKELGGSKLAVGSDEALKYLLYMVDVNQLFDVALGMYDFDLALLIATKSQKDPKEYIPMLNEFNDMDENYKRFTINKHLKRFDNAVACLVECGSSRHAELRTFVKYHSLYKEALRKLSSQDEVFKEISDDYGLHLKLKKQHTQAGIVYERANNIEQAVACYVEALEWELALSLAQANMWSKERLVLLSQQMVGLLQEEKRNKEALTIMEQFYENHEDIIEYAIECGQYKTALRLCALYKMNHLKDEKMLPALLADCKNIKESIESQWSTFIQQRERLFVVRCNKIKNPPEIYDYNQKDSDLYSDAGSTITSSSRGSTKSRHSSKNRRKHERKMASLKEGSQYEDVALILALHKLVTVSHDMRLQVRETVIALSHFGKDSEASVLQTSLAKLLKEMTESFKNIWTHDLILEATNTIIAASNAPEGTNVVLQGIASLAPHLRIAPIIRDVNWKLDGID